MDSDLEVAERLRDVIRDRTFDIPAREIVREGRRRRRFVRVGTGALVTVLVAVGVLTFGDVRGGATVAGFSVLNVEGRDVIGLIEPSGSMEPTIVVGQVVAVDVSAYEGRTPGRGDIVAFTLPGPCSSVLFKRIVGLPGETVEQRDGVLFVDGRPVAEPRDEHGRGSLGPWVVEPGHLFVVGDHLANSNDSRFGLGQVGVTQVVGEVDLSIQLDRADVPAPPACTAELP